MTSLSKNQLIIMLIAGGVIISVIAYYIYTITYKEDNEQVNQISEINIANEEEKEEKSQNENQEEIVVHIAGEVKNPGIIRTKEGARIADIIEKAGGITQKANINDINLAYIIEDGQKITIPSKEQEKQTESITTQNGDGIISKTPETTTGGNNSNISSNTTNNQKININNADKEELQNLQGIGEATAEKIIEYRKQNGIFKQIEDIKSVPGIGEAKFENIKENISVK